MHRVEASYPDPRSVKCRTQRKLWQSISKMPYIWLKTVGSNTDSPLSCQPLGHAS